jgi:hypothetical protein
MQNKSVFRILFLDKEDRAEELKKILEKILLEEGTEFIISFEKDLDPGYLKTYDKPTKKYLQKGVELINQSLVDLIIIGNNTGVGLQKAKIISEQMKEKVIITWNAQPWVGEFFTGQEDSITFVQGKNSRINSWEFLKKKFRSNDLGHLVFSASKLHFTLGGFLFGLIKN